MEQKMKKVGGLMSIYMGITLSLCLSLVNNLTSKGGFMPLIFLITFVVSLLISLLIGFIIPMGKISRGIHEKIHGIGGALIDALVSDLIYTPVITLAMVALVRKVVTVLVGKSGGAEAAAAAASSFPPFPVMFLGSFAICMAVGFVLILIFQPVYMKLAMKQCGINGMPGGPNGPGGPRPPQE